MRPIAFIWSLIALFLFEGAAFATTWSTSVDSKTGLPILQKGGADAMTSSFAFWRSNWSWAGQRTRFEFIAPFEYSTTGENKALQFDLSTRVRKVSTQQMLWEFNLNAHAKTLGVVGGGIVFKFDLAKFGREMGEPEILPENNGWAWGRKDNDRIEIRFDPPLASIYFEAGRRNEIRAFFYSGEIPIGKRNFAAQLKISGDMRLAPTLEERFDLVKPTSWNVDTADFRQAQVDLSFLNTPEKPAGKRGFLKAVKDKLVFEDGTPGRFWGTNLTASSLFGTSRESVRQQAKRLSQLGFNLVRFHHHDSSWVNPNIFGDRSRPNTRNLDPAMLDKLDWWIKCLKDEGIYVWLDLHVGHKFNAGDRIDNFEEIAKGESTADLKGYNYVNRSIIEAMKRFNEAYLSHLNSYTRLTYKDDPAIVGVLITNENDVTSHFGSVLLPDKKVPKHGAIYMSEANSFASAKGLPLDKTWRSWEHGPSKLFLNDLEKRFNADVLAHLRQVGVRTLVATTNTWGNPLSSLPALTTGDLVDVHSYGKSGELEKNPIFAPTLVHWIAAAHVTGKPLTVTEWNVESFPAPDRQVIPLYVAASGSLHGWAAMMHYAYSQVPLNNQGTPSNWHAFNDPALLATLPAAALIFRQRHVRESEVTYAFIPTREQLFYQKISPDTSVALRTAAELGKLVIAMPQTKELPWLERGEIPAGAKIITDTDGALIAKDAQGAVTHSGELERNWEQGIYTIRTPRSQAAMGWIGGKKIKLFDVEIFATTRSAMIAVQSLDGKPISDSRKILISMAARSVLKNADQLPFHSEPVEAEIKIRAPKGLRLFYRRLPGQDLAEIPARYRDGNYTITLDGTLLIHWLFLEQ